VAPPEEVKQSQSLLPEQLLMQQNPHLHWTDAVIQAGRSSLLDLEDQINQKSEHVALVSDEYLLQYGPKTLAALQQAVRTSFKLFWDGSISMYQETTHSSTNNKDFLSTLLEVRTNSDQDEEPPVTLIHGAETEHTLRKTLLRIKIDQQEALEALQRAAKENQEEDEEDEINVSESKAEISTF
jgi:hypothetical protein